HMQYLELYFFFQAEDGIRDRNVTGVQTCALPISDADEQLWDDRSGCAAPGHHSGAFLRYGTIDASGFLSHQCAIRGLGDQLQRLRGPVRWYHPAARRVAHPTHRQSVFPCLVADDRRGRRGPCGVAHARERGQATARSPTHPRKIEPAETDLSSSPFSGGHRAACAPSADHPWR